MFTGIVTAVGTVRAVARDAERLRLTLAATYPDLLPGESVAVDGACLTVVAARNDTFDVEVIGTTRGRTRLGDLQVGDPVNLERALAVGDRFGGHFVQGHVDGVGEVLDVRDEGDTRLVDVRVPDEVAALTVVHGSIALDGVSLTVNALPEPGVVQVALIPFTLEHTALARLTAGARVHVEGDLVGKYVRQLVGALAVKEREA